VLALGLAIGVWMYSGFESISTLSGEIRNPQKIIPRALMLVIPFVVLMYVLPTVASLAAFGNWDQFAVDAGEGTVSFVDIGRALGGSSLAAAMMASALLGNLALYLDYLAAGARPLFAIASDGLFPRSVAAVSGRFGTPAAAIILMAAVNAVLVIGPFRNLVVIDVMLFTSAYVLIYISAVRLRIKEPGLRRPFRIPLGTRGLIAMVSAPVLIALFTLYVNAVDRSEVLFGIDGFQVLGVDIGWMGIAGAIALASGPVLYPLLRARYGGPDTPPTAAGCHEIALAEAEARTNSRIDS
jgi:amino acid transporter